MDLWTHSFIQDDFDCHLSLCLPVSIYKIIFRQFFYICSVPGFVAMRKIKQFCTVQEIYFHSCFKIEDSLTNRAITVNRLSVIGVHIQESGIMNKQCRLIVVEQVCLRTIRGIDAHFHLYTYRRISLYAPSNPRFYFRIMHILSAVKF